ncbi:hypothetical protein SAMN02745146_2890 [Hymenobacter daecheongensis DSM 21074]|uniref:DUF2029 domain-containing protein n=1 Tax=Hymenobacter daecheongensis DSM 21074 TaxID=1121955 RepID=A0A1M6ILX6_9BACT|nr:hypothetical protein [Hymenobacter daecheongensis]SHJ35383.1 hypothetical protein SAMN02745146_2890 [Hymenobacter daecheongensis DSM 21074]
MIPPGSLRATSPVLLAGIGLLFVLETLFFTYLRGGLGPYWSPLVLYLLGLALCLLTARAVLDSRFQWPAPAAGPRTVLPRLAIGAGLTFISWLITAPVIAKLVGRVQVADIGVKSDIIPALQVYVTRFLGPETVYRPITLLGYTFLPNYPPLQWLPFVPAELWGLDYRAWAFGLLLLALLLAYQWPLARLALPRGEWLLKAVLPVLVLHFAVLTDKNMYSLTVESLIVGYYLVLAGGTLSKNPWLKALGLVLCLLSRFSLALWVPLYGLLLLWENRRRGWLTAGLALAVVVLIFGPFLLSDPTIFLRAQLENMGIAEGEWQRIDPRAVPPLPMHLFNGVGFAPWFYDMTGTLTERIARLQTVHFAACTAIVVLSGGLFWRFRHRFDPRLAALLSLKVYLATFYGFLIIPYTYLASVSLFTSLFVVLLVSRKAPFLVPFTQAAPLDGGTEPEA